MTRDDLIRLLTREIVRELDDNEGVAYRMTGMGLNPKVSITREGERLIEETIKRVLKDEARRAA